VFIHKEVDLSTIEQRIPRIDDNEYGGNQAWFSRQIEQGDGCGVIAATNLFYYYRYPEGSAPSKEEYLQTARELYKHLKPLHLWNPFSSVNSYGLPFFTRTLDRIRRFLFLRSIIREVDIFRGRKRTMELFIRRSLREGDPVLFLTIGHPKRSPYNNHYVLITGIEGDKLIVSTWGQRRELSLKRLVKDAWLVRLGRLKDV
jgi:hypothetical protein